MSLDNETTSDVATFDHFDRTWTIPNKRHLSHIRYMRDESRNDFGSYNLLVAEAFLSPTVSTSNQQEPDQFAALLELDPDERDLNEFVVALGKALGFGGSGNSSPSSASS